MSGLFGGGSIVNEEPRISALRIQTSVQGAPITVVFGKTRITGNMLWYGDLTAIKHKQKGGKGGGGSFTSVSYTYRYSLMLGLCEGPIGGVDEVWMMYNGSKYKQSTYPPDGPNGGDIRGFIALGGVPQTQGGWGPLYAKHPDQALQYSGIAYAAYDQFGETSGDGPPVFSYEVRGFNWDASIGGADPGSVVSTLLTNTRWGASFPAARVGDLTSYSDYAVSLGLMLNLEMREQRPCVDWLTDILRQTHAVPVWSADILKIVPLGDAALSGNGRTWTPNVTPLFDLDDDDFLPNGESPLCVTRKDSSDASNMVSVEFRDRDNEYNTATAKWDDAAAVALFGARPAETVIGHGLATQAAARTLAQLTVQRLARGRTEYSFRLGYRYCMLEPMDIVTVTDSWLGIDHVPVRILTVEESPDGELEITAEEFPAGAGNAAAHPNQPGYGYIPDHSVDPGDVLTPVIFEPPVELAPDTGLEVWVAAGSSNPNWGGCTVWVSLDGTTYKEAGQIVGGCRFGRLHTTLGSAAGSTTEVQLLAGGQLLSASSQDVEQKATLCWVGTASGGEFITYTSATLTDVYRYSLSGLVRGEYDSPVTSHAAQQQFVRIDDAVVKSGALELSQIGQPIYLKFTSFNIYKAAEQSLADVAPYVYTVTGVMANLPPAAPDSFTVAAQPDGTRQFAWSWVNKTKPRDLAGYRIRYKLGTATAWADMAALHDGVLTSSPYETNSLSAGTYTLALVAVDTLGNESAAPIFINAAALPDPRFAGVVYAVELAQAGWPGTKTDCAVEPETGYLVANDNDTWSTIPGTWADWTTWIGNPKTPIVYQHSTIDFGAVLNVTPYVQVDADGTQTIEERHSNDNSTWSSWAAPGTPIRGRYVEIRITVAATGGAPVPRVRSATVTIDGKTREESINDRNTSTYPTHTAAGDVRIPIANTYTSILEVRVTLQSVGAGWTWELVDKNPTSGPRIRIYNQSGAGADALVDAYIKGV